MGTVGNDTRIPNFDSSGDESSALPSGKDFPEQLGYEAGWGAPEPVLRTKLYVPARDRNSVIQPVTDHLPDWFIPDHSLKE
jgi:hypothetical protein